MRFVCSALAGIFALLLLTSCVPSAHAPATARAIRLYFYSDADLRAASFDHPVVARRSVTTSGSVMDAALRQLFAGPADAEKKEGARTTDDLLHLGSLYLGMSVDGTTATVNFRKDALPILNSAAARQMMVKSPIRATLLQFPGITDVQYAIDGRVFTEWDA